MNTVTKLHDSAVAISRRDSSPTTRERRECLAIVADNQTHTVVSAVCEHRFQLLHMRDGSSREAMEILAGSSPPGVLILDTSDAAKPLTAVLPIMATFADETKVIAIGTVNDIAVYRELMEAGVVEYLVKPITEKALLAALARLEAIPAEAPAAAAGAAQRRSLIAVIGTRGGVGASTVAVNCAWIIANHHKQKITLLDLDLQNGTIALALDIEPTRGLREALENPARIDSLFIASAATKVGERLWVMAAEEGFADDVHYDPSAVDLLLEELHRQSECIVVDLPRGVGAARSRVLAAATDAIIVTDLTLGGLRDSIRLAGLVQQSAPETRVLVVANRGTKDGVGRSDFEKALGRKIDVIVPDEGRALVKSANSGKPVAATAANSKMASALRSVTSTIFPDDTKTAKASFWSLRKKKK